MTKNWLRLAQNIIDKSDMFAKKKKANELVEEHGIPIEGAEMIVNYQPPSEEELEDLPEDQLLWDGIKITPGVALANGINVVDPDYLIERIKKDGDFYVEVILHADGDIQEPIKIKASEFANHLKTSDWRTPAELMQTLKMLDSPFANMAEKSLEHMVFVCDASVA